MNVSTITLFVCVIFASFTARAGTWTEIGSNDATAPSNISYHTTLFLEMPVVRSNDGSLVVAHYRVDSTPGYPGLYPGQKTKSMEMIETFDCANHEHWASYSIGLPFPAMRNTIFGSGPRRQVTVNNFITGADVNWAAATVGAHVCANR